MEQTIIRHDLPDYLPKSVVYEVRNNTVYYKINPYIALRTFNHTKYKEVVEHYKLKKAYRCLTLELPEGYVPEQIPQYISVAINTLSNNGILEQLLRNAPFMHHHHPMLKTQQKVEQYLQSLPGGQEHLIYLYPDRLEDPILEDIRAKMRASRK